MDDILERFRKEAEEILQRILKEINEAKTNAGSFEGFKHYLKLIAQKFEKLNQSLMEKADYYVNHVTSEETRKEIIAAGKEFVKRFMEAVKPR